MHITCVICCEMFTENSEALATLCGHIFHTDCLQHWFENSKTCPQCRRNLKTKELVKLYMNITTTMDGGLDVSVINDKLQNAQHDILLKDLELKALSKKLINMKIDYEIKIESQKTTINNMKDKLNHIEDQARSCELLRQEIANLNHINVALKGTQEEVWNLIRNENNIKNLAVVTAALKKSLAKSDKKNIVLQTQLKKAQIETFHAKKELSKTQDEYNSLKAELINLKKQRGPLNKDFLRIKDCNRATRAKTTIVDLTNPPCPRKGMVPSNSSAVEAENLPLPVSRLGVFTIQRDIPNKTAGSKTIFKTKSTSAAAGRPRDSI